MMHEDPALLHSMLCDRDRNLADLAHQLDAARLSAIRWEHEAKSLRREVQRLRMDHDTSRIERSP